MFTLADLGSTSSPVPPELAGAPEDPGARLVAMQRRKNRENMTDRIHSWKQILNALTVRGGDRITDDD